MAVPAAHPWAAPIRRARTDAWLISADMVLVAAAWAAGLALRYDGSVAPEVWRSLAGFLPLVLLVAVITHACAGLYAGVSQHASFDEARRILVAQLVAVAILLPADMLVGRPVPASVPLIGSAMAAGLVGAIRFRSRLFDVRRRAARDVDRILVIGAGDAGASLAHDVQSRRNQGAPVVAAFLDDDPGLRGRRIHGVPVVGRLDDLPEVADELRPSYAVLAVPSASPDLLHRLAPLAESAGVVLRVVPPLTELVSGNVRLTDVRDIDICDLLRRQEVDTNLGVVTSLVSGKRVLITGAGGSIGSEIARQVSHLGAARTILVDHDETHLFDTAATVPHAVQRLCDIRQPSAVRQVLEEERPEIVFHAAAHKHVPLLEDHPVEAAETNVLGTRTVVGAATAAGVERFVFISTDKAVRPSSVMGASKSLAEKVVLGEHGDMTVCAVRFGNVLGSRGSVVPTFVQQIRAGGPVTVTDARMTRFFMTIPEAVRLVLHAAALAEGNEIFMLDMGEPVSILALADRMIRLSGRRPGTDVEIRVTGIRPGEKLSEELHTSQEMQLPTAHPSVVRLLPGSVDRHGLERALDLLAEAVAGRDDDRARDVLFGTTRAAVQVVPSQKSNGLQSGKGARPAWTS